MSPPPRPDGADPIDERVAALRHDLRTPLGQILGYAELVEEELVERGQQDLVPDLRRIRDAARALLARVDRALGGDGAACEAPGAPAAAGEPAAPERTGSILVVDDEAANRDLLSRVLEGMGYEVETVASGVEAVRAAARRRFDLILLDVMLPGMDGPATLGVLRRNPGVKPAPVAFVTARALPEERERYLALGAAGVIAKPFDRRTLGAEVGRLLGREATPETPDDLADLAAEYAAGLPERITGITRAWEALRAAPGSADALETLRRQVHRLAGTGATYGFSALSEAAARLERDLDAPEKQRGVERLVDELVRAAERPDAA